MITQISCVPASPPSSSVRVSAAVAPCARDPRIRTDLAADPRVPSTTSFHQTAVVLPTQAKLLPSTVVALQTDGAVAADSGTVENIFELLQKDLNPIRSKPVAAPRIAECGTRLSSAVEPKVHDSSAVAAESGAKEELLTGSQETDTSTEPVASPQPASKKPGGSDNGSKFRETPLKGNLQRASSHSPKPSKTESKHVDPDKADRSSRPGEGRYKDWASRRHDEPTSSKRRSLSRDREKSTDSRRRAGGKEDGGPGPKRMRRERQRDELKSVDSSASLPSDFM